MVVSAVLKGQAVGGRRGVTVSESRSCSQISDGSAAIWTLHDLPLRAAQLPRRGEQGGPVEDVPRGAKVSR